MSFWIWTKVLFAFKTFWICWKRTTKLSFFVNYKKLFAMVPSEGKVGKIQIINRTNSANDWLLVWQISYFPLWFPLAFGWLFRNNWSYRLKHKTYKIKPLIMPKKWSGYKQKNRLKIFQLSRKIIKSRQKER